MLVDLNHKECFWSDEVNQGQFTTVKFIREDTLLFQCRNGLYTVAFYSNEQ